MMVTRALSQTAPCLSFPNCKREIIKIHLKIVVRFSERVRDSMTAAVVIVTVDAERAARPTSCPWARATAGRSQCASKGSCIQ